MYIKHLVNATGSLYKDKKHFQTLVIFGFLLSDLAEIFSR